jgi:LPXTG-site transpeptidase (sortase) family protein
MKYQLFLKRFLVISGSLLIILALIIHFQQFIPRHFIVRATSIDDLSSILVSQVKISDLKIDLPIYPSVVTDSKWEINNMGVSLLVNYQELGFSSSQILYGHNWPSLLGNLTQAKIGQEIELIYNDDSLKRFQISKLVIVPVNDLTAIQEADQNSLVIYTCSGFMDKERLIVLAEPLDELDE